jgi:hypothetical protein
MDDESTGRCSVTNELSDGCFIGSGLKKTPNVLCVAGLSLPIAPYGSMVCVCRSNNLSCPALP